MGSTQTPVYGGGARRHGLLQAWARSHSSCTLPGSQSFLSSSMFFLGSLAAPTSNALAALSSFPCAAMTRLQLATPVTSLCSHQFRTHVVISSDFVLIVSPVFEPLPDSSDFHKPVLPRTGYIHPTLLVPVPGQSLHVPPTSQSQDPSLPPKTHAVSFCLFSAPTRAHSRKTPSSPALLLFQCIFTVTSRTTEGNPIAPFVQISS